MNGNGNGNGKGYGEKRDELVAVGIDKDKNSQYALKWAIDHILNRGQTINLIYVKQKPSTIPTPLGNHVAMSDVNDGVAKAIKNHIDSQAKDVFLPFRAFCTRKDIKANEVILEDMDVANAICNYVKMNLVETLVIGASTKNSFIRRFKSTDVPANVSKGAPEFCSIYVISKGKISSVRSASIPVPNPPPRPLPTQNIYYSNSTASERPTSYNTPPHSFNEDSEIRSPFNRYHQASSKTGSFGELLSSFPENNSDISCVGRPSIEQRMYDFQELGGPPRLSIGSDSDTARMSIGSAVSAPKSPDRQGFSSSSDGGGTMSWSSSHNQDEVEAEMRRLKQELKQTMDMYSNACKETLTANQKAMDLQQWKTDEQQKVGRPRLSEQATMEIIEKEKAKTKAAIEAAEAAQRMAELEAKKRINAEMVARKESEERRKVEDELSRTDVRYRKYSIEEIEAATDHFAISRKIGEGGYGPVYKCYLDHTPVAVKVLRPDAAQGRSQFQQEVEVLSCIRHPNMVLLLGACPEYGCLVYEYMGNGSLEDRLYRRGNTPIIPWQLRFKIAAEIATGLLFLHQAKPEPLVHRDLKPANILLDQNYVSKISDVGLARLVPPSVADTVTQYRMTSTAGTFCYIDPEYQQTGMLGIKSDIYSLGILLLQIITGKPPMGLTHHVERAIERGVFVDVLDPYVSDWPVQDTLIFAKIALQCAELRRKDRPDLKNVVLPELNRLRNMAEDGNPLSSMTMRDGAQTSPCQSQISLLSSHEMNSESSQSTLGSSYN